MSGIVGIFNWDGTLVDPALLSRMTDALKDAGPDGQHIWLGGAVGFGHASLRIPADAAPETQPLTLDGRTWITACGRIDGRIDLVRQLTAHGCYGLRDATDTALLLHAYRVWGESCVRNLRGDFAFAIWDDARRQLFCARDHFGVKPFFYAEGPHFFVFSSSLQCLRLHPGVSGTLDDQAIADFLSTGGIQEPARTCWADIRRLPAAHCLTRAGDLRVKRYWALAVDGEIRYRRGAEYIDHFADLLRQAVSDRLRGRAVGVLMSGGLDSTSVTATAKRCLEANAAPYDLRAYTTVCDRLVPDPERRFAQLAADALSIPIHYRVVEDYHLFERWDKPELRRPEPEDDPLLAVHVDQLSDAAVNGRVLLTGYGADPAVRLPLRYATDLVRSGKIGCLATEVARYVIHCRRLPRVRLWQHARRWLGREARMAEAVPVWLAASTQGRALPPPSEPRLVHPTRADAYELLTSTEWPLMFERFDPGLTGVPVDVRHPFFDVRLVEYLLAIPPMPWCFDKTIVRLAMRGALPDAVRLRPKTVAAGDPVPAMLRSSEADWIDRFDAAPTLARFVDRARVPPVRHDADANAVWTNLRPLCLNLWLQAHDMG